MTRKPNQPALTHEYLTSRYSYDPITGEFRFKSAAIVQRVRDVGRVPGGVTSNNGYKRWRIEILGKSYTAARLAWFYMTGEWPKEQIDHIDKNSLNNAFANLREANSSENTRNHGKRAHNTSGWKGVSWHKSVGKWHAHIGYNNKKISLGYFDDVREAAEEYMFAALELHGEFARLE